MTLTTNKYRNKKIKNAYGTFDSMKEYRRFLYLSAAQKKGIISELTRQKKDGGIYRQTSVGMLRSRRRKGREIKKIS